MLAINCKLKLFSPFWFLFIKRLKLTQHLHLFYSILLSITAVLIWRIIIRILQKLLLTYYTCSLMFNIIVYVNFLFWGKWITFIWLGPIQSLWCLTCLKWKVIFIVGLKHNRWFFIVFWGSYEKLWTLVCLWLRLRLRWYWATIDFWGTILIRDLIILGFF